MDDGVKQVLEESSKQAAQKAIINKDIEDIMIQGTEGKDSFGIPVFETSWQSLKITSKIDDEEVVQDISALSPVKVQFLLRYWFKQIQDTLKARQIELDQDKSTFENIYIKNMSSNGEYSQDVIHAVINALEEKLDQIVIRSLRISAEKQTQMLLATVYTLDIAAKNVAIYKQGHYGICFVGFKDGVLQIYDVMNSIVTTNSPCARQVRINNFYAELLLKLGFIEYVNKGCSSKIEISIDAKNQIILMNKASVRDVHYVVEKIQAFRKCVVKTKYNSAPSKIALLRLNETKKRVDGILRRENVLCFVDICYESDSSHIYTRTEEEGKIAVMILETSLQEITVRSSFVKYKNFEQILNKFPGEILILHSESKYTCKITCTNDALADISVALVNVDHPDETKTLGNTQKKKALEQVGYEESDGKPKQVQKMSGMIADVNQGIFKLEAGPLETILKDLERKYKVSITQSNGGCRIEGDCLNRVQEVKLYLENIGKENGQVMDKPDQSDSSFTDDFQNFISVPVSSKIKSQAYMYFYGDDLCRKHGIQIDFSADALIISGIALPKNGEMAKNIMGQVQRINQMTTTHIPFKREELQLMKVYKLKLEDEYKDGFFYIDEENFILFVVDDYNFEQRLGIKHRVKILLGQIQETKTSRIRRFAAGDNKVEKPEASEYNSLQARFSSEDHNTSFRNHGNGSNFSEKKQFTTKEGIIVYVYSQSILQLDVDCIVNAANKRSGRGTGVAAFIARLFGYEMKEEDMGYIRQHGEIPVGECCHTTAGKLPYKYVIHTVGPRWNKNMTFEEQTQCKKELQNAVESCFYEADKLGMRSIGVPSVSAGIFGMPPYICARQYCEAVINYSQQRTWNTKSTTLKEIHFIDMNVDMCRQIADVFSKCGELSGTEAGLSGASKPSSSRHSFTKSSVSGSLSHGSYDSRSLSHSSYDINEDKAISNSEEIVFRPCTWITIHLLQKSITEVNNVSVVVSPENLGFNHQGTISRAILAKADKKFSDRVGIIKDKPTSMKSVFTLDCTEGMPWKHVVYAIAPRWGSEYVKSNQRFEVDLKDTMVNILNEVQMKGAKSLAVPLLGTARKDIQTPVDTCCRAMLDGIWSIINKGTRAKKWKLDLWIVTTDPTAIHTFENMLDTKFGSKSPKTQQDAESSKLENKTTDDKALDEDCCICMDKITDPKWLPCKHVFCTDCIDQQFTFKPACPQCGAVHGIVTGDQPPGTISRQKQHYSLPGYPECKTIAITYSFPSGYQTKDHPNPGKYYTGIDRTGYLPDNKKGRLVASLLEEAFKRRLVFTIGRSVTTGQEGVITWNDIHHKTKTHGGRQGFGYPDETYLNRVANELAAKGVTEESL